MRKKKVAALAYAPSTNHIVEDDRFQSEHMVFLQ